MTEGEIEELRESIEEQRVEVRELLAEELGGSPDDYRAEAYLDDRDGDRGEAVPDGGE